MYAFQLPDQFPVRPPSPVNPRIPVETTNASDGVARDLTPLNHDQFIAKVQAEEAADNALRPAP
jgi:hypothetical protein